MDKDLIQQTIKEKEILLNGLSETIKKKIVHYLEQLVTEWEGTSPEKTIMKIFMEEKCFFNWLQRLKNNAENTSKQSNLEPIKETLGRKKFFIYPKASEKEQNKIWICACEVGLSFSIRYGQRRILETNKDILDENIIQFDKPVHERFYVFIDTDKVVPINCEPVSFWLKRGFYDKIGLAIGLHINQIIKENADSWFLNIEDNITNSTSTNEQAIDDYKYQLINSIKPLSSNLPFQHVDNPKMFYNLQEHQVTSFITLDLIRKFFKVEETKYHFNLVDRWIADNIYRTINEGEEQPKELFKKIKAFHVNKKINERIAELSKSTSDTLKPKVKGKREVKDPTFLELFKSNQDRVHKFFKVLKSREIIDNDKKWSHDSKRKSSIVACFQCLEDMNYIKKLKKASLHRIIKSEINFEGNEKLFRNWFNPDDYDEFQSYFIRYLD